MTDSVGCGFAVVLVEPVEYVLAAGVDARKLAEEVIATGKGFPAFLVGEAKGEEPVAMGSGGPGMIAVSVAGRTSSHASTGR
jgi:hypothetical protein